MKRIFLIFSALLATLLLVSCGAKKDVVDTKNEKAKVAIVYSTGGKGDNSFNDSAHRGLLKAKEDFGIEISEYEPKDPSTEARNQLATYAESGEFELIIGTGFSMKDSVESVAKEFPDQKFAIIDDVIEGTPNVASLLFKEHEGSFLMGALASLMTKSNTLGFVGGIEGVPVITRFHTGFNQGARYINPEINILPVYIGGNAAFNDPASGKTKSETLIQKGADVIYHAAGGSGMGVFQAAKEKGVYAIGVDSDQDGIEPGVILSSMIKNVDVAVYNTIKDSLEGNFKPTLLVFGVKEDGVGISELKYTREIIGEENIAKLEEIKEKIKNGEIVVTEEMVK